MPEINSMSDLKKYLAKIVIDSMEDVGDVIENKLKDVIEQEVYHNPTNPEVYERTRELETSIIHTPPTQNRNEIITEVKHDDSLFGHYAPNQHVSVVDESELPVNAIAEIVNYGKAGHIFGTGYWTEPRPYMDTAKEEIIDEKLHVRALKNSLESKGIKTE
jgi:hypothetical protein